MTFEEWVNKHQIGPGMNDRDTTRYSGRDGTVGIGWVPLLDALATDLKAMGWTGSLAQVKEKFGGLRFYADPSGVPDDQLTAFDRRISRAEDASTTTCEACGAPGRLGSSAPGGYWLQCRCAACAQEQHR